MSKCASKVINIALAEVGYLEKASNKNLDIKTANAGQANYTKFARDLDAITGFYNGKKNGYAWCDCFVDWCFVQAFGVEDAKAMLCQPNKSYGAGCLYSARYYKDKDQFYTKNPKVGDQIFFWDSKKTTVAHTGLVYKVDGTYVYTVEGNTSSASGVVANGGAVAKKKYKLTYNRIYGYGRPKYDAEEAKKESKKETKKAYKPTVKEWQLAAIADGYKFPKHGADGEWGAECVSVAKKAVVKKRTVHTNKNLTKIVQRVVGTDVDGKCGKETANAIRAYQQQHDLPVDGQVGLNTWKKILNI